MAARLAGLSGTATVAGVVLGVSLFAWHSAPRVILPRSAPLTVALQPLSAPPEPVREVAPGPVQVERQEAVPQPRPDTPPPPMILLSDMPGAKAQDPAPVELVDPGPPIPQTTAPKAIEAPAAPRLSSEARPNWEASVLAHLERFRRYPPRARAARQQGVVQVRFTMNRAGAVLACQIVRKSGSFTLDQAALETVRLAQPLPAIPAGRPDTVELTVPIEFRLR
ncbi:energy transducer TonB [Novosphingobium guangzhouense]|uniref:Protein TonB n=1 Tax=Novosphingobium guangzhouense TaxID=1850347 RepID=A0A2K2G3J1_9SPHN|nr:energy transducer TonB [Novosphingobium guangzhouense]